MNDDINQVISAALDDEASDAEVDGTCRKLCSDSESRKTLARYQMIGDAMRNDLPQGMDNGLADRVSQALQQEPTVLAPAASKQRKSRLTETLSGLAVAASVAAIAILGVRNIAITDDAAPAAQLAATPVQQNITQASAGTRWNQSQPVVEQKLNRLLLRHYEYAPGSGMTGLLPYANIVNYDSPQ